MIQATKISASFSFDEGDNDTIQRKLNTFAASQGDVYEGCCFENYSVYNDHQRKTVDALIEYADNFPKHLNDLRGFVMLGPSRTGKGHLARSVCVRILQRYGHLSSRRFDSLFCSVKNCQVVFQQHRDGFQGRSREATFLDKFTWQALLVLEDPFAGGGKFTESQASLIYRILEVRFQRGLPTGITSNLRTVSEFRNRFEDRNMNRLGRSRLGFDCSWPSFTATR